MAKYAITPVELPLGLGTANAIEIVVNYSIGDETTDLKLYYYYHNGLTYVQLNVSPHVITIPSEQMLLWNYDFAPIVMWALNQINAQLA